MVYDCRPRAWAMAHPPSILDSLEMRVRQGFIGEKANKSDLVLVPYERFVACGNEKGSAQPGNKIKVKSRCQTLSSAKRAARQRSCQISMNGPQRQHPTRELGDFNVARVVMFKGRRLPP